MNFRDLYLIMVSLGVRRMRGKNFPTAGPRAAEWGPYTYDAPLTVHTNRQRRELLFSSFKRSKTRILPGSECIRVSHPKKEEPIT
jgi:hypothetical protein